MIIAPAFWRYSDASEIGMKYNPESEGKFLDAAVVSRAFENTCAVLFCNVAGPASEGFAGLSQVAMPFLGCVDKFDNSDEGMKIVSLDMKILEEAESVYKIREDIASPDWHYDYRRWYAGGFHEITFAPNLQAKHSTIPKAPDSVKSRVVQANTTQFTSDLLSKLRFRLWYDSIASHNQYRPLKQTFNMFWFMLVLIWRIVLV